jgi:hypothetical protein
VRQKKPEEFRWHFDEKVRTILFILISSRMANSDKQTKKSFLIPTFPNRDLSLTPHITSIMV